MSRGAMAVVKRGLLAILAASTAGCFSGQPSNADLGREQPELRASFRFDDCEFMARMAEALSDAGIAYRVEKDGSISHRSEEGAAVQRIGNEVMEARLQNGRKLGAECVKEQ
jgi:hypothetical protein